MYAKCSIMRGSGTSIRNKLNFDRDRRVLIQDVRTLRRSFWGWRKYDTKIFCIGLLLGDRLVHTFRTTSGGKLGLPPPVNRHRFERIVKLCAAVTTHAIGSSVYGEDAAKIAVVTAEYEVQQSCEVHALNLPDGRLALAALNRLHV